MIIVYFFYLTKDISINIGSLGKKNIAKTLLRTSFYSLNPLLRKIKIFLSGNNLRRINADKKYLMNVLSISRLNLFLKINVHNAEIMKIVKSTDKDKNKNTSPK